MYDDVLLTGSGMVIRISVVCHMVRARSLSELGCDTALVLLPALSKSGHLDAVALSRASSHLHLFGTLIYIPSLKSFVSRPLTLRSPHLLTHRPLLQESPPRL